MLERGIPLFRNGLTYAADAKKARSKGFSLTAQLVIDRAQGDFVWDVDGAR